MVISHLSSHSVHTDPALYANQGRAADGTIPSVYKAAVVASLFFTYIHFGFLATLVVYFVGAAALNRMKSQGMWSPHGVDPFGRPRQPPALPANNGVFGHDGKKKPGSKPQHLPPPPPPVLPPQNGEFGADGKKKPGSKPPQHNPHGGYGGGYCGF